MMSNQQSVESAVLFVVPGTNERACMVQEKIAKISGKEHKIQRLVYPKDEIVTIDSSIAFKNATVLIYTKTDTRFVDESIFY